MKNVMPNYLTSYIANDLISISTVLAIRQVLDTKCRYLGRREIFVETTSAEVIDSDYKDYKGLTISKSIKYQVKVR